MTQTAESRPMGPSSSLHRRFISVLVLTASVLAMVAAWVSYELAYRHAMEGGRQSLHSLADAVDKTVAVAVYANDSILLQELLAGIRKHSLVLEAQAYGAAGEPLPAGSKPGGASPGKQTRAVLDGEERLLYSPFDKKERIGLLQISVNSKELQREARRAAVVLGLAMVALTAVLALVLNTLARQTLSKPLNQLALELARMEPGTDQRLELSAKHLHDELGTVAQATNRLLQANDEALKRERKAREDIAAMEALYRQIFDFTSAGIFVLSMNGRLLSSNPTVARLLGTSPDELSASVGESFVESVFLSDSRAKDLIATAVETGETSSGDLAVRCSDGSLKWVHCLFTVHRETIEGKEDFLEGVIYDVTARKREERAIRQRAHLDTLTGLKNRAGTNAALDELVSRAQKADGKVCVFFIDLDGFKAVNDNWGHAAGDLVLIECARRLQSLVRQSTDLVGRLGGDELLLAVRDLAPDGTAARALATGIVAALSKPIDLGPGQHVRVGASVGLAGLPAHAQSAAELLSEADRAMYVAKRAGKNRYAVASRDVVE